ncbi:TrkA family potassium uptake protein [Thalassospira sp. NFXS8]
MITSHGLLPVIFHHADIGAYYLKTGMVHFMAQKKDKIKRSFVIIGLGTFGGTIATELARFGNRVLGIDVNEKNVSDLANTVAEAVIADGRDEEALRQAGADHYDVAVVAIGEDLEANILCTMNVKLLGIKTVWVKALSKTHHRILSKMDADRVILPEQEMGQHIAQMLHNPVVRDYLSLGNNFHVININVPEELEDTPLSDLKIGEKHETRCLGVMRGSEYLGCEGDIRLKKDDKMMVLGRRDELRLFGDGL